jgi:hypothetical protein
MTHHILLIAVPLVGLGMFILGLLAGAVIFTLALSQDHKDS